MRFGKAELDGRRLEDPANDITALLDAIIRYIPAPTQIEGEVQMLITSLVLFELCGPHRREPCTRGAIRERHGSGTLQERWQCDTPENQGAPYFSRAWAREKVQEVVSGETSAP